MSGLAKGKTHITVGKRSALYWQCRREKETETLPRPAQKAQKGGVFMNIWLITFILTGLLITVVPMAMFRKEIKAFLTGLKHKVKYVCSDDYDPKRQERMDLTMAFGFALTVAFTILRAAMGYRFNGFFGFIERLLVWGLGCFTVVFVLLCLGRSIRYARSLPRRKLLAVCLLLPAGILTAYMAGKLIGFPLFRAIMTALDKSFFYGDDQWPRVCVTAATLSGLYVWFFTAKASDEFRKWPVQLAVFALVAVAAVWIPLGIGAVFAFLLFALALKVGYVYIITKYATTKEADAILSQAETAQEEAWKREAEDNMWKRAIYDIPAPEEYPE